MREVPEFPAWETATPPATRRWLAVGAFILLFAGGAGALVRDASSRVILAVVLFVLIITGFFWLCRQLYYRFSLHNESTWKRHVAEEKRQWWVTHQSLLALREVVLLGPSGGEVVDWVRVLSRVQRFPVERQESGGKAFRIARTFSADITDREQQLARALVVQWKNTPRDKTPDISHCFWLGSDSAWSAFCTQIKASFPDICLPESPEPWQGEATLSRLAALLREDDKSQHLVAGCVSCSACSDNFPYAGESAALWVVGSDGPVVMPRGEFYDAFNSETLENVSARAVSQCGLQDTPDACILFSHPQKPEIKSSGWNTTHRVQDAYWGTLGKMEPLVVISLAAILARLEAQPCCWIATDPQHTLALGIVKPHGKG